jgi:glyoxylase-like metal-dependent hydrolase (beta-lactamase superfamily II)
MRRLAAVLVLTAATALHAQQDFSQVKVTVVPVAKGVYMLQGAGGNIGLSVGNDDAFVIDDQYAPLTPKIKAAIATVTAKPVRFVMNTHWHGDHTGGNENMAAGGAILVAHENVRKRMSVEQFIEAFKQTVPPSPAAALPVITFTETISFYVNGDSVRATHVKNAHTDGDAIILFQGANVIHMGDTFFNGFYPFIDVSSGGTLDGIVAAADRGLAMADASTKVIPGHGELGDKASLKKYRDVMADARDRVAKLIAQKKTLAQIIAAKPLADYDSTWGKGFMKPEQFLTMVHAGMTKKTASKVSSQHHEP